MKIVAGLLLGMALAGYLFAQEGTTCPFEGPGLTYSSKPVGTTVTLCWDLPAGDPNLQFLRLRRSQTVSGYWEVVRKMDKSTRAYTFTETLDANFNYMVTAFYQISNPDGTIEQVELPSNGVLIRWTKATLP